MALLGFTKFKEKILSGEKKQTIRKLRKRRYHLGDRVYLYWHLRRKDCELLKVSRINYLELRSWKKFCNSEDMAIRDGFKSTKEMQETFRQMHSFDNDTLFWIIRWE